MAISGLMIVTMMMSAGMPAGNDIISWMDSKTYWDSKSVTITVKSMTSELIDPKGARVRPIRKLMAIRTLGELKNKQALGILKTLKKDKTLFVADYASWAIASIEGKAYTQAKTSAVVLEKDLTLLPSNCGAIAQMPNFYSSKECKISETLDKIKNQLQPMKMTKEKILAEVNNALLKVSGMTGNVRIDAITLGISQEIGDNHGFIVAVWRGLWNTQAIHQALATLKVKTSIKNGIKIYHPDKVMAFIILSDNRAISISAPNQEEMPLDEIISKIKANPKAAPAATPLPKLVKSAKANKPDFWAVARISNSYRQAKLLAAFDTVTFIGKRKKDMVHFTFTGEGKNAENVVAMVKTFEDLRKQGIKQLGLAQTMPFYKPLFDCLQSVKISVTGKKFTLTASLKGDPITLLFMMAGTSVVEQAPQGQVQGQGPNNGPQDVIQLVPAQP